MDMSATGWGTEFKLSQKPGWLTSNAQGDSIINTTLLLTLLLYTQIRPVAMGLHLVYV